MPFVDLPDGSGKIYVPEMDGDKHKHPCPDCFSCQWCSNDRCNRCRSQCRHLGKKKGSRLCLIHVGVEEDRVSIELPISPT